jgi:phenylalanyl-tRNA synthetase beta chain
MRVPLHWLRELVDVDVSADELAEKLSMRGAAVDSVERFAPGVSGIVAGRVSDTADVEGSDKLCISHIDVGPSENGTLEILAGAKNFNAGDIIPVAKIGARVTTLDVPISARKMMGAYESQGMLCSAKELGVADEHEGILVLDPDTPVGADVVQLLGLDSDVLEFEIYPNRPDLMSVLGIARQVAAVYGTALRYPDTSVVEDGAKAGDLTSVTIEDRDGCPRYLARVIENVTFGTSPALIRARLTACGVRPLGNLIDATNYVLLLTGQPLHAFDLDKLAEQRIVVRRARSGEKLNTLDGEERTLDAGDLVIADARDAQAIAGVMGGADSEVGPSTKRVLLESAYFEPTGISRTSRRHRMRTEASARFERGADPEMVPEAAAAAAELMRRWAGGTVAAGAVDEGSAPERRRISLRVERIPTILGIDVDADDAVRVLGSLGCDVDVSADTLDVGVPSWRPDLEREVDLIEEVAQLHGYENIPAEYATGNEGGFSPSQLLRNRVRATLLGAGLAEATLSTFVHADDIARIGYDGELVRVSNPMTEDQEQLRPSLFPGLLRAAQRNVARGTSDVRLFEVGNIFRGWPEGAVLPDESEHVAFVMVGNVEPRHWSVPARDADAFDAKGVIELVLDELGIHDWELRADDVAPLFHPGRSANVFVEGAMVGRFGEVRPSVARAFDLEAAVVGGLSLDPLFEVAPTDLKVVDLPTQPPVLRDIAIALAEDVAAGDVTSTMREAGAPLLESIELVDVYRGAQVGEGRKSLAFRLTFRAPDRTLTAAEADAARDTIARAVAERHGGDVR